MLAFKIFDTDGLIVVVKQHSAGQGLSLDCEILREFLLISSVNTLAMGKPITLCQFVQLSVPGR